MLLTKWMDSPALMVTSDGSKTSPPLYPIWTSRAWAGSAKKRALRKLRQAAKMSFIARKGLVSV